MRTGVLTLAFLRNPSMENLIFYPTVNFFSVSITTVLIPIATEGGFIQWKSCHRHP